MRFIGRALLSALLLLSVPALADDVSNGSYSTTDGGNNASPPNGWPAGMFPNQVEPSARANMGGTKRWWERANAGLTTTGAAGAYILTPTNTAYPTAYTQGEIYCAKANFTSVGNDTLNVNGLGAKPVYGAALIKISAGAIVTGQQFCASYDSVLNGAAGGFQLLSVAVPTQSQSANGYTFLSGGLLFQWGESPSSTTIEHVTFPRAFPNVCFTVIATMDSGLPNYTSAAGCTTTGFDAYKSNTNSVFWFAIGN